jgi:hypothetical protein
MIDTSSIEVLRDHMLGTGKPEMIFGWRREDGTLAPEQHQVALELIAASVNYCYWYGDAKTKPAGGGSSRIYELLRQTYWGWPDMPLWFGRIFCEHMSVAGFPLVEDRVRHIRELYATCPMSDVNVLDAVCNTILHEHGKQHFAEALECILRWLPGMASDVFLKRVNLFFLQLYRIYGWFGDEIDESIVPADYEVPRALKSYGCLRYSDELNEMIEEQRLIPRHSRLEAEIRANTIVACEMLCEETGWNISEVDSFLWLIGQDARGPHHLTVTTDY